MSLSLRVLKPGSSARWLADLSRKSGLRLLAHTGESIPCLVVTEADLLQVCLMQRRPLQHPCILDGAIDRYRSA